MEFYYKFMDRFQNISKVKNPALNKASALQYLEKQMFYGNMMLSH